MRAKWDTGRGYRLWIAGIPRDAIGEALGITGRAVGKYAERNRWPRRRMNNGIYKVQPVALTKRCPGCLAIYRVYGVGETHQCGKVSQSLYEVAA